MKLFLIALQALAMVLAEETSGENLLVRGNQKFTTKMFSEVVKAKPEESVVMSAFSVLTPLAQLSFASEGSSHDELLRAIGMSNDNNTKEAFGIMKNTLRSMRGVNLTMASGIFVMKGYDLLEDFQNVSRDLFGSDVRNVDFVKNVETAAEINEWVEEQTNHRIKELISSDSLSDRTRAVLANAIYFKGSWKTLFDKEFTYEDNFYASKEKTVKVPFMSSYGRYDYKWSKELDAELVKLPYEGDEAWMLFVLPTYKQGLAALEEKLENPDALINATRDLRPIDIIVGIPKFKIETTTNLKQVLEKMDVARIFDDRDAHLNKILKGLKDVLFVSEAKQKAFIEVNEEGAEAAAANEVVIETRAGPPSFYANRPFYFEIQAKSAPQSNEYITLFSGVYKA